MKVITMLQIKGGESKTTLAIHMGAGLANAGYRVLLVDADPQGSATYSIGHKRTPGFYDLLVRDADFKDVIEHVSPKRYAVDGKKPTGDMYLIPSNVETRNIAGSIDEALRVKRRFNELQKHIDFVIFDTSPTPSLLHATINLATDYIMHPTKCEAMSVQGLRDSLRSVRAINNDRKGFGISPVKTMGIVPSMFRKSTLEHTETLGSLVSKYNDLVWRPITQSVIWAEAARIHQTVWTYAPQTSAGKQALMFSQHVNEWVNHYAS